MIIDKKLQTYIKNIIPLFNNENYQLQFGETN